MNFKPSSPKLDSNDVPQTVSNDPPAAESPAAEPPAEVFSGGGGDVPADELRIENAMRRDRFRLPRQKKRLSAEEFQKRLRQSVLLRRRREAHRPHLEYSDELPISRYREALVELIRDRQVIVVCGETGSGKSTQLPKFCLEAGLGRDAMIGHTQLRRLAARSIATRLSEEMRCPLGGQVGYQVRFGDKTGPDTMIK